MYAAAGDGHPPATDAPVSVPSPASTEASAPDQPPG